MLFRSKAKLDNPLSFSVIKEVVFLEPAVTEENSKQAELLETDLQTDTDYLKTGHLSSNGKDNLILTL